MRKPVSDRKILTQYGENLLKFFYQCQVKYIRYLGGGSYGRVFLYRIKKHPYKVVMKACLLEEMAHQEVAALEALRRQSILPIVEVYHVFEKTKKIPYSYILMQYIPGKSALFSLSLFLGSKKKKAAFAATMVENLASYHEKKQSLFGDLINPTYDDWYSYYFSFADRVLAKASEAYSHNQLEERIFHLLEEADYYRSTIFEEPVLEASLIHGDYNISNVLVNHQGKLLAVIDPLHTMWADKEYDLFQLRNLFGDYFHLYQTYKEKYSTSKRVDLKCAYYALFHEMYVIFETGERLNFILMPLVKRLEKELEKLKNELKNKDFLSKNSVK